MDITEILMPERLRRSVVVCPKCQSSNTARTGAYTLEPGPQIEAENERSNRVRNFVVYDRKCMACGRHFTETVERSAT